MRQTREQWGWRWLVVYSMILLTGCGTLPNGRRWGQDATLSPGWQRVGTAARDAALSPQVWVPAVGACVFLIGDQIGHIDQKLSNWAVEHTPVFRSQEGAAQASDYLQNAARAAGVLTALATPSGPAPEAWKEGKAAEEWEWLVAKGKGMVGVEGGAVLGTFLTTYALKETIHRSRPDTSDPSEATKSFPSGHASHTAVWAMLASRNVATLPWPEESRTALQAGLTVLTLGAAWARVEAKQHFPSDVLFGAALGNFFGAFINEAFLGLDGGVTIQPSREGVVLGLHWPW
jgi:membrane-associated phospholipid phosphatase